MGALLSKLFQIFVSKEDFKIVIVGLDNAGKTTIVYKLLLNEAVVTTPTIGSNVEEITYKNMKMVMWDIGGQESLRTSWVTYYTNAKALIMVIDSTDVERLNVVKDEMTKIFQSELLQDASILIFANKQDCKGALSAAEITEKLNLTSIKDRNWHIQACCALTGDGLYDGLDWILSSKS
ncbi:ADP-ribosylation factor-like protein 5B [Anaeromyces robustus]|uniref:ADP-ribosylation factor-like protein 5B n=1 Tax=Anaeromyces robustus TaxID=1754192 RepID=A0A1Y1XF78_9FUNG|nr:ADP-ribosylation factor-like protein 5B [Anaeromyces robustus]|eukprot:ORX84419.1 ADP-ribosylation factor-like protein 5B [Anaeromyces robustus]